MAGRRDNKKTIASTKRSIHADPSDTHHLFRHARDTTPVQLSIELGVISPNSMRRDALHPGPCTTTNINRHGELQALRLITIARY